MVSIDLAHNNINTIPSFLTAANQSFKAINLAKFRRRFLKDSIARKRQAEHDALSNEPNTGDSPMSHLKSISSSNSITTLTSAGAHSVISTIGSLQSSNSPHFNRNSRSKRNHHSRHGYVIHAGTRQYSLRQSRRRRDIAFGSMRTTSSDPIDYSTIDGVQKKHVAKYSQKSQDDASIQKEQKKESPTILPTKFRSQADLGRMYERTDGQKVDDDSEDSEYDDEPKSVGTESPNLSDASTSTPPFSIAILNHSPSADDEEEQLVMLEALAPASSPVPHVRLAEDEPIHHTKVPLDEENPSIDQESVVLPDDIPWTPLSAEPELPLRPHHPPIVDTVPVSTVSAPKPKTPTKIADSQAERKGETSPRTRERMIRTQQITLQAFPYISPPYQDGVVGYVDLSFNSLSFLDWEKEASRGIDVLVKESVKSLQLDINELTRLEALIEDEKEKIRRGLNDNQDEYSSDDFEFERDCEALKRKAVELDDSPNSPTLGSDPNIASDDINSLNALTEQSGSSLSENAPPIQTVLPSLLPTLSSPVRSRSPSFLSVYPPPPKTPFFTNPILFSILYTSPVYSTLAQISSFGILPMLVRCYSVGTLPLPDKPYYKHQSVHLFHSLLRSVIKAMTEDLSQVEATLLALDEVWAFHPAISIQHAAEIDRIIASVKERQTPIQSTWNSVQAAIGQWMSDIPDCVVGGGRDRDLDDLMDDMATNPFMFGLEEWRDDVIDDSETDSLPTPHPGIPTTSEVFPSEDQTDLPLTWCEECYPEPPVPATFKPFEELDLVDLLTKNTIQQVVHSEALRRELFREKVEIRTNKLFTLHTLNRMQGKHSKDDLMLRKRSPKLFLKSRGMQQLFKTDSIQSILPTMLTPSSHLTEADIQRAFSKFSIVARHPPSLEGILFTPFDQIDSKEDTSSGFSSPNPRQATHSSTSDDSQASVCLIASIRRRFPLSKSSLADNSDLVSEIPTNTNQPLLVAPTTSYHKQLIEIQTTRKQRQTHTSVLHTPPTPPAPAPITIQSQLIPPSPPSHPATPFAMSQQRPSHILAAKARHGSMFSPTLTLSTVPISEKMMGSMITGMNTPLIFKSPISSIPNMNEKESPMSVNIGSVRTKKITSPAARLKRHFSFSHMFDSDRSPSPDKAQKKTEKDEKHTSVPITRIIVSEEQLKQFGKDSSKFVSKTKPKSISLGGSPATNRKQSTTSMHPMVGSPVTKLTKSNPPSPTQIPSTSAPKKPQSSSVPPEPMSTSEPKHEVPLLQRHHDGPTLRIHNVGVAEMNGQRQTMEDALLICPVGGFDLNRLILDGEFKVLERLLTAPPEYRFIPQNWSLIVEREERRLAQRNIALTMKGRPECEGWWDPDTNGCGIFGVFDGHSGVEAANYAAHHFIRVFLDTAVRIYRAESNKIGQMKMKHRRQRKVTPQFYHTHSLIPSILTQTFRTLATRMADRDVTAGTCCVVCVITPTHLFHANIGDSRSVLVSKIVQSQPETVQLSCAPPSPSLSLLGGSRVPHTARMFALTSPLHHPSSPIAASLDSFSPTLHPAQHSSFLPRFVARSLTLDHKPHLPKEREFIYNSGGFLNLDRRVNGVLAVSRALGDLDIQPGVNTECDVFVDVLSRWNGVPTRKLGAVRLELSEDEEAVLFGHTEPLSDTSLISLPSPQPFSVGSKRREDVAVVIGCDGLYDVLSNEQIARIVNPIAEHHPVIFPPDLHGRAVSLSKGELAEKAALRLRSAAEALDSSDNVSVIVHSHQNLFQQSQNTQPLLQAATIQSTSLIVSECSFHVESWSAPFTISEEDTSTHTTSSITIISSRLLNRHSTVPSFVFRLHSTTYSDAVVAVSGCKVSNSRLSSAEGLALEDIHQTPLSTQNPLPSTIETALSNMRFENVSSPLLPRQRQRDVFMESLRQTLTGSDITLCNNHLAGTTIRDVNRGGSLLCQNASFTFCHAPVEHDFVIPTQHNPTAHQYVGLSVTDSTRYFYFYLPDFTHQIAFASCSFKNMKMYSDTAGGAAAIDIFWPKGRVAISDCVFTNCEGEGADDSTQAGAVHIAGGETNLIVVPCYLAKSTFTNCNVQKGGGGGYRLHQGESLIMDNCTFDSCYASLQGGGSYMRQVLTVVINEVVFKKCTSQIGGGMRIAENKTVTITSSIFEDCTTVDNKNTGGLVLDRIDESSITDTVFTGCKGGASGPGGLLVTHTNTDTTSLSIESSKFTDCTTNTAGGGMKAEKLGSVKITGTNFTNCQAVANGGGCRVYAITHSTIIRSCFFDQCSASGGSAEGGGLYLNRTMTKATVEGCAFSNCGTYSGGGLFCDGFNEFEVDACNFTDCISGHIAGALRARNLGVVADTKCTIQNTNFTNCSSLSHWGGAMSLSDLVALSLTSLMLKNCSCSSGNGGGIDVSQSDGATITDVTFEDCSASAGSGGGLIVYNIYAARKATTLTRVKCVGCSAKESGGGVYLKIENAASFVSCQFEDCEAGGRGGGLACETPTTFSVTIDDATTFTSCQSTSFSGNAISLRCRNVSTELDKHSFDRFKQPAGQFISLADRRLAFGSEVSGVSQPLSFFWYPYTAGEDVHVRAESEDHALSGRVELPFATIGEGFKKLSVDGQKVLIDSPLTFSTKVDMPALAVEMKTSSVDNVVTVTDAGLLSLEQGTLTLTNTKFAGSTRDTSFITVTLLGSLSVQGCTFTGFTSTSAGSVLSTTLTSNTVTITSSSFSSCSSSENGGALSIVFGSGSSSSSLTVKASFSGCSCGVNKLGSAVFVSGSNLESLIKPSQWTTTGLTQPSNSTLFWGTDSGLSGKFHSTSLLVYLVAHSAQVVSVETSDGKDVIGCGEATTPCKTLSPSMSHLTSSLESNTLSIIDSATLDFELTSTLKHLTLTGPQAASPSKIVTVSANGQVTAKSNTLSFSFLKFITSETSFDRSLITVSSLGSLSVQGCTFTGFTSTSTGSVLSATLTSNAVSITSSSFSSCSSSENGGALSIEFGSGSLSSSLKVKASFSECSCGVNRLGSAVFVSGSNLESLIEPSQWTTTGLTQPSNSTLFWGTDSGLSGKFHSTSLLVYLVAHSAQVVSVETSDGKDVIGCGEATTPCKTLSPSMSHLTSSLESNTLSIIDSATLDFELTSTLKHLTLTGPQAASPSKIVTVSANGQVTAKSNTLSFSFLKFITSETSFDRSLITVSSLGSLSVQGCTFTGFTSTSTGSVLSATLTSNAVSITSSSFSSCSSSENGGALSIEFGSGSLSSSLKVKASFSECSCGVNRLGSAVFVSGSNLESLIEPSQWTTTGLTQPSNSTLFWGTDSGLSGKFHSTSLLVYLVAHSAQVVSVETSDGKDVIGCGEIASPCLTLQKSVANLKPSMDANTLSVIDSATLDFELTSTLTHLSLIGSHTSNSNKKIAVTSTGKITADSNVLSFMYLDFTTSELSFDRSLITVKLSGSVSVSDCTFTGFHSTSTAGSVLSATLTSNTVTITSSSFSSCSSSENGGALSIVFGSGSSSSSLNVDASFSKCSCGVNKHGSAVFVSGSNLESLIKPSQWTTTGLTQPSNSTLFWGTDSGLSGKFHSTSLLVYLVAHSAQVVSVETSDGKDVIGCGEIATPLESNTLSIIDSTTLNFDLTSALEHLTLTGSQTSNSNKGIAVTSTGKITANSNVLSFKNLDFTTPETSFTRSLVSMSGTAKVTIDSCSFTGFHSSVSGSILSGSLSDTSSLSISSSSFSSCTSDEDGGVISVFCSANLPSSSLVIDSSFAPTCTCGSGKRGEWVFVSGSVLETLIKPDNWNVTALSHGAHSNRLWGLDASQSAKKYSSTSLLVYLVGLSTEQISVMSSEGKDVIGCGEAKTPCQTLKKSVANLKPSIPANTLTVIDSASLNFELDSSFTHLSLIGAQTSNSNKGVVVTSNGKITASSNALSFKSLDFTTSEQSFDHSLITVSGTGSVDVDSCTFTGFHSLSTAGSVLSATLTSNTVSITSSSFSSCSSSENGGALSIVFGSGSSSSSLNVDASFSKCSCGVNKHGSAVFVSGSNLESLIKPSQWTTTGLTQPSNSTLFWGTDSGLSGKFHSTSLLVYLVAHSAQVVSVETSDGKDVIGCGEATTPCKTLSPSMSHLTSSLESNTLSIIDSATLDFELTSTLKHLTLTGSQTSNSNKGIAVTSTGKITADSNALSFSYLGFTTPETSFSQSLISMSGTAKVTIESCSFTGFHSSVSGSILSGSLLDTSSLSITSSTFSSCTSDEDGGVISVSCSANLPSSSLVIDSSFAPTCTCGSGKRGEWVFVSGHNFPALIESSFWTASYSGLSSPTNDNLIFGEDLAENDSSSFNQITLLFYLLPYRSDVIYSSPTGRDSNGCGHDTRPCQRMDLGHSHLEGTGNLTLWIVTSARLEHSIEFHPNNVLIGSLHGQGKVDRPDIRSELGDVFRPVLFERTDNFNLTLVKIVSGSVEIDKTTFSSVAFTSTPFVLDSFKSATFQDVIVKNCSLSLFIDALCTESDSEMNMRNCSFTSISTPTPQINSNNEGLCEWDTGILSLTNCSTTIQSTVFTAVAEGIAVQSGGSLDLTSVTMSGNGISEGKFTSTRKNIRCVSEGTVNIVTPSGDGADTPSHWISGSDCTITKDNQTLESPLFVAELKSNESSSTPAKNGTISIVLGGRTMIPCGLFLEVFEDRSGTANATQVPLSETSMVWPNDTHISLTLTTSSLSSSLSTKFAWKGRLLFGNGVYSTETIKIRISEQDERKALMTEAMKWLLPLIIALSSALLLFLLILFLLIRRHRKKKQQKPTLVAQQELDIVQQDIKYDDELVIIDPSTGNFGRHNINTHSGLITPEDDHSATRNQPEISKGESALKQPSVELVEGITVGKDAGQTVTVNKVNTLYNRLHTPSMWKPFDRRKAQIELTKGLAQLAQKNKQSAVLKNLSSHWVLLGPQDEILLKNDSSSPSLSRPAPSIAPVTQADDVSPFTNLATNAPLQTFDMSLSQQATSSLAHPSQSQAPQQSGFEEIRWMAPELVTKDGHLKRAIVDTSKTAVFSLGLVLFEIETGEVPFGESDALNAHRQLEMGVPPRMSLVSDESFRDLILRCINPDFNERPTLDEVVEWFDGGSKPLGGEQGLNKNEVGVGLIQ
ncbi:hypothetical protein BLNAU_13651 [Blattamonas nauphoetae]|uniref:PPM-type phosphatase domain-containing protein n=1 Tax=Blattamonas nauphoetae TaxID=2049346 RepID=A0ABQ9XM80_9EUKA|nr:hypothetical protein BLNAU_13651 [Blattamonas nauphoetae]